LQLKAGGERNFSLVFEFSASLGHRGVLVFEWMHLPTQPLCNAIHVIPADEVTLTQCFLRPPTMSQHKRSPAAAQALPIPLAPQVKRRKRQTQGP